MVNTKQKVGRIYQVISKAKWNVKRLSELELGENLSESNS